jgi:hypothetical protein
VSHSAWRRRITSPQAGRRAPLRAEILDNLAGLGLADLDKIVRERRHRSGAVTSEIGHFENCTGPTPIPATPFGVDASGNPVTPEETMTTADILFIKI